MSKVAIFVEGQSEQIFIRHLLLRTMDCSLAIMELEAWFLAMYDIFSRINSRLSVDYIEKELGFNLADIDPQTEFFKPAEEVHRIFQLVGLRYQKSTHDVESICSRINTNDLCNAFKNRRCSSFRDFYQEMIN